MAGKWKMIAEFGKAVGKKVGKPNKTSEMVERVAGDSDEFLEGKRHGQFLRGKATDASYQAMYDKLDDDARRVFDAYDMDFERGYGPKGAYQEAVGRAGVDPNDVPGDLNSWQERFGFDISDPAPKNASIAKRTDARADRESDIRLQDDFEKAFDDAAEYHGYKKWREESKDMPLDDGFGGDMHDMNRMDAEQRVREEMIRDKHALSDDEFLDKWFDK